MSSRVVRCYGSRRRTLVGAGETWKASPVVAELVADALECDDGVVRHVLASELTWDDVFSDNAVVVSSSSGVGVVSLPAGVVFLVRFFVAVVAVPVPVVSASDYPPSLFSPGFLPAPWRVFPLLAPGGNVWGQ